MKRYFKFTIKNSPDELYASIGTENDDISSISIDKFKDFLRADTITEITKKEYDEESEEE